MPQLTPERAADFARCRRQVLEESFFQHGIGSLSERESHAILKNFYCPDLPVRKSTSAALLQTSPTAAASPKSRPAALANCAASCNASCPTTRCALCCRLQRCAGSSGSTRKAANCSPAGVVRLAPRCCSSVSCTASSTCCGPIRCG